MERTRGKHMTEQRRVTQVKRCIPVDDEISVNLETAPEGTLVLRMSRVHAAMLKRELKLIDLPSLDASQVIKLQ